MQRVERFITANGRRIYALPVRSFPTLVTNLFIIRDDDGVALVDCGSGVHFSNDDLVAGLAALDSEFGESIALADFDTIFITHGHIDHYGALPFVRAHNARAQIGVHILDRSVLEHHTERVTVAAGRLRTFLAQAGVPDERRTQMMQVYLWGKSFYRPTAVQFELAEGTPAPHDIAVYHVPGHCAGLVCLQVDDILLTADHILSRTTPHQAPEWIVPNMGLGHYFASLDKIARLPGIALALGCHEEPMPDVYARIATIRDLHQSRLARIVDICDQPRTLVEVSRALFGPVKDYHVLLALEEAGAHVEYLHQRGALIADNLDEIEQTQDAVIRYVRP